MSYALYLLENNRSLGDYSAENEESKVGMGRGFRI